MDNDYKYPKKASTSLKKKSHLISTTIKEDIS